MADEKIRVVDLETKLAADEDGSLLAQITDELQGEQAALKRYIDSGLTPDEFERAQTIYEGLQRAGTVMNDLWQLEHR